jgi:iron complex outermembrane receptor protein
VDWDPAGQRDALTLQGDLYRSDSSELRSVPQLTAPYATVQHENITAYGGNLLGRWNRELTDDSKISLQAYYDMTSRDQLTVNARRNTFDIDGQYEFAIFDWNKAILGAEYRDTTDHLTYTPIITGTTPSHSEQLFSGFVQDKITLMPESWFLTLGSKFEHNDFTGLEIQPNARLQWLDGDLQSVWASVARAVRTPSELEHDLTILAGVIPPGVFPLPVSVLLQPSPSFKSEELVAYELGYRRQWTQSVLMDISAFYNDYDNLSTLSLMAPQLAGGPLHIVLPIATTNLTKAKTYGLEAVVNWRVTDNLKFSAAYSMLNMDLDGPPSTAAIDSEGAKGQSPQHQFNVRSQWDVTNNIALDTTLYYVDSLAAFHVPAYWRLDARLGWRLTDKLQFDLVGQNLFNDVHRETGAISDANAIVNDRSLFGRFVWRH